MVCIKTGLCWLCSQLQVDSTPNSWAKQRSILPSTIPAVRAHCSWIQWYGNLLPVDFVPISVYANRSNFRYKVYIWGGRNDNAACNILFCFDTNTHSWSQPKVKGQVPGARDGHSACIIKHCMYVFGGYEEDIDQFSQDVHMLDLRTMEWRHLMLKVNDLSDKNTRTVC